MNRNGMRAVAALTGIVAIGALVFGATASATPTATDALVSVGSPSGLHSQNLQAEPAVAVDAHAPNVFAAGAIDAIDEQACPQDRAPNPTICAIFQAGGAGVYFSFDSGHSWIQPTYTGWTARDCPPTTFCSGHFGPIGTVPWYYESGLEALGDPAVAFGPRPVNGVFSWSNGSRLYYASIATGFNGPFRQIERGVFNGVWGVAVARLDNPTPTSVLMKDSWLPPVLVSAHASATTFEDKEQIWADNAASSPFFGNVYACYTDFRSRGRHFGNEAIVVASSRDGGDSWVERQTSTAGRNLPHGYRSGCTLRTDSHGVVYLFYTNFAFGFPAIGSHVMRKSFDGGIHWTQPQDIVTMNDSCWVFDPMQFRCVGDGFAGARADLMAIPSVDIANGAPSGADATDEIVDAWSDGRFGLNSEKSLVSYSTDGGSSWSEPSIASAPGDRPYYTAPALSPDGSTLYLTYNAFQTPFQTTTAAPRLNHGVLRSAPIDANGAPTNWTTPYSGPLGDSRGTAWPLFSMYEELLGDYVYAAASRTYGVGLWTEARNAADCPAMDSWRQASLDAGTIVFPVPWPLSDCPATFGNSDIYSATTAP